MTWYRRSAVGCLVAVLAVIFLAFRGEYFFSSVVLAGIYAIAVMGLVLLIGLSGQVSLSHGAFFGIGAYASAILSTHGVPSFLSCIAAVAITTLAAAAVAVPIVRLRGHLLALATLALGVIAFSIFNGWKALTLGPSGIANIPPMSFGPLVVKGEAGNFVWVWGAALVCLLGALNLWQSAFGRAALAVKRDEAAASAMGIDVVRVKVQVFALSCAFAGFSGALYAHYVTFVAPDRFDLNASFELLLGALLGGVVTPYGAIAGAVLLIVLPDAVAPLKDYKVIFYGAVFILVSLYLPQGLAGACEAAMRTMGRRRRSRAAGLRVHPEEA